LTGDGSPTPPCVGATGGRPTLGLGDRPTLGLGDRWSGSTRGCGDGDRPGIEIDSSGLAFLALFMGDDLVSRCGDCDRPGVEISTSGLVLVGFALLMGDDLTSRCGEGDRPGVETSRSCLRCLALFMGDILASGAIGGLDLGVMGAMPAFLAGDCFSDASSTSLHPPPPLLPGDAERSTGIGTFRSRIPAAVGAHCQIKPAWGG
jgi:hypothetical protein